MRWPCVARGFSKRVLDWERGGSGRWLRGNWTAVNEREATGRMSDTIVGPAVDRERAGLGPANGGRGRPPYRSARSAAYSLLSPISHQPSHPKEGEGADAFDDDPDQGDKADEEKSELPAPPTALR